VRTPLTPERPDGTTVDEFCVDIYPPPED